MKHNVYKAFRKVHDELSCVFFVPCDNFASLCLKLFQKTLTSDILHDQFKMLWNIFGFQPVKI